MCDKCAANIKTFENVPEEYKSHIPSQTEMAFEFPNDDNKRAKLKQKLTGKITKTLSRVSSNSSSTGNMEEKK